MENFKNCSQRTLCIHHNTKELKIKEVTQLKKEIENLKNAKSVLKELKESGFGDIDNLLETIANKRDKQLEIQLKNKDALLEELKKINTTQIFDFDKLQMEHDKLKECFSRDFRVQELDTQFNILNQEIPILEKKLESKQIQFDKLSLNNSELISDYNLTFEKYKDILSEIDKYIKYLPKMKRKIEKIKQKSEKAAVKRELKEKKKKLKKNKSLFGSN